MEIQEYAEFIYRTSNGTPISDFQPSLLIEEEKKVRVEVLGGVPEEEYPRLRAIVLEWAESSAGDRLDFFTAYRDGEAHFRIIHRKNGIYREALFPAKTA